MTITQRQQTADIAEARPEEYIQNDFLSIYSFSLYLKKQLIK